MKSAFRYIVLLSLLVGCSTSQQIIIHLAGRTLYKVSSFTEGGGGGWWWLLFFWVFFWGGGGCFCLFFVFFVDVGFLLFVFVFA